jgi:hypothetical protein
MLIRSIRFALAACLVALLLPAAASAGKAKYAGTADADPTTTVGFKLKSKPGVKKVVGPKIINVRADCTDDDGVSNPHERRISLIGSGPVKVEKKKFKWRATEPFVYTMIFEGKLQAGGTAQGTFEFFGDYAPEGAEGPTYYCETGVQAWSAARQ